MRKYKAEKELREIAKQHSEYITVCTPNGEKKRKATKRQNETLYGLFYGALLGLNFGETARSTREMEQAIIDATEFQADILFRNLLKEDESLQGYITVYCPLQKIVREWETTD